jgi:hypothetical protein
MRAFVGCLSLMALVLGPPPVDASQSDLSRPNAGGAPVPVEVSIYLADLHTISGSDGTFFADVVLQASWVDRRFAVGNAVVAGRTLDDIWNPRLQIANQRGISNLLPERVEIDPFGRVRYRQRWIGRLSVRMNLKDFPLDRQQFRVHVVSLGYTRNDVDLKIVPGDPASGRATALTITDWRVGPVQMDVADYEPAPGAKLLAGVELRWNARRHVEYYAVQVILPLVFIVLMGSTALWIDPTVVTARVSVSMTAMLTLIAYRFALAAALPPLSYLTRLDYFMLGSTVLIFLNLLLIACGAHLVATDRTPLVARLDRWARRVFPLVFIVIFGLSWWG